MSNIVALKNQETPCFYIKYYPGIKSSLGCEKATLILGRLEYWFEKYSNGFYKFVEPCTHPLYREGDSWSEEIGFSRKIFAKAFDLIGVRYKSKSAFNQTKDKFQGKLYASYHDRKTNQTYFIRNHHFASDFIKGLFNRKPSATPQKQKKVEDTEAKKIATIDTLSSSKNGRSWSGKNVRSSGGIIGGKENKPIQRNTSSLEPPKPKNASVCSYSSQTKMTEEMIKIWNEEVGDLGISLTSPHFLERLHKSFKSLFNESLEGWKTYCQQISSSKFLMGEAQNKFFKKAWITWAIKEEVVEQIRGGGFKLGDRQTNHDKHMQNIEENIKLLENKRDEIKYKMESVEYDVKKERKSKVKEKIKTFSGEEIENLKQDFEEFLEAENNSITKEFKQKRWKGMFVQAYFEGFVEEKVTALFFNDSAEHEAGKIMNDSGLLNILEEVEGNILQLKQKRRATTIEQERILEREEKANCLSFQMISEAA